MTAGVTDAAQAAGILAHARESINPAMRGAVARLDERNRRIAEYHLGYADANGTPTASNGGKAVRGALALLSARSVGASGDVAIPAAVAVELVHHYSLLHDDIIDEDATRRHRPAAWTVFGAPAAILAGDAMAALATAVALEGTPSSQAAAVGGSIAAATMRMLAGQAADVAFEKAEAVDLEACRQMVADKTGALLECAASVGALAAGAPDEMTAALARFGGHIGMAFQLVDDIIGIWGSADHTGKPVASDLASRKKSLPVVAALAAGGPHADRLAEIYSYDGVLDRAAVETAARAVEATGARSWAQAEADRETDAALAVLGSLPIDDGVRAEFRVLTAMLCRRDR
jgi:geranylgeranyl diphosphate synthase type I